MNKNVMNALGIVATIGVASLLAWFMVKPSQQVPQVMIPSELVVPPVYNPSPGDTVGEGPSESQPQPVYPPVVVPPVYVPEPGDTVGEAPSASQPQPVYPKPEPVEEVVPVPTKKPVVVKPQKPKPVKVIVKKKKKKKCVSRKVTYPKQMRSDFYPRKYWKK
jgi:hypothetical protein